MLQLIQSAYLVITATYFGKDLGIGIVVTPEGGILRPSGVLAMLFLDLDAGVSMHIKKYIYSCIRSFLPSLCRSLLPCL